MTPSWPLVVAAIALVVVALANLLFAVVAIQVGRTLGRQGEALGRLLELLQREAGPTLQAARSAADDARQLTGSIRTEVNALVGTSREIRGRLERAADLASSRLADLDALLDVVQEEVEETALDVAATLRSVRRGVSLFGLARRAFGRRRR